MQNRFDGWAGHRPPDKSDFRYWPVDVKKATKNLITGGAHLGTAKDGRGFDRRPRVVRNAIRNNRIFRYADRGETKVELANRFTKSA